MSSELLSAEVRTVLAEQNPWHRDGLVPESLALDVERQLTRSLWQRLGRAPRRFHLVLGPRRVGKTTAMYQTVRRLIADGRAPHSLWWIRMDHPHLMVCSLGDLVRGVVAESGATPDAPVHLFLDEIVYARDWDLWLKTMYDERWPVEVVATSSATAALKDRHRESGIGRWDEHLLTPYSFAEYLDLIGEPAEVHAAETLAETLRALPRQPVDPIRLQERRRRFTLLGGFPELLSLERSAPGAAEADLLLRSQQQLRGDAVERAVYKDIPQSFGISNPMLLERLLYLVAGQMGGLISAGSATSDLDGMSQPTFDRYLSYLQQTFLVFLLRNYSGSEAAVQRRGRKAYFWDGAVRNAALQRGLAPLQDPGEMGLLLENLVAAGVHGLAEQAGRRLYFWRDGRFEVDLVLDDPLRPLAFEVGSRSGHSLVGLRALAERHPRFAGGTYLVAPDAPIRHPAVDSPEPGSLPLEPMLLAVNAQSARELTRRLALGTVEDALLPPDEE